MKNAAQHTAPRTRRSLSQKCTAQIPGSNVETLSGAAEHNYTQDVLMQAVFAYSFLHHWHHWLYRTTLCQGWRGLMLAGFLTLFSFSRLISDKQFIFIPSQFYFTSKNIIQNTKSWQNLGCTGVAELQSPRTPRGELCQTGNYFLAP